ncbi:hypothetical protein PM082_011558 [Marasmius tenuissimus]|nr:hypothetical protein PM082_011558 [Marasmius tenuissimus]
MAQPVFDDHPLGQYLREAGETSGLMPGGTPELMGTLEEEEDISLEDLEEIEKVERLLEEFLESIRTAFSSQSFSAFTEKFKYNVISSSLLSSSLTTTHTSRHTPDHIPGNLSTESRGHSRSSSVTSTETNQQQHQQQHLKSSHSLVSESQYLIFSVATALLTVLFGAGYYCSSVSIGAILLYIFKNSSSSTFMTPTLDTLNDLIVAGNVWDSVVQEVMTKLEKDEKHMIYSSNTPTSPRSSLRVALHSTLLTTQNQSDNVRQLLSALASQSELSQISYMYAPPSPVPSRNPSSSFPTTHTSSSPASRPFSLPTRRRTISNPKLHPGMTPADKRATWNGSYAFLADAGSPTMQILKRREKRRSDLTALLQTTSSFSAPVTPSRSTPGSPDLGLGLAGVNEETELAYLNEDTEEEDGDGDGESDGDGDSLGGSDSFGMAALELQRKRKLGGMQTLTALPTRLNRRRSWNRGGGESYSTTATPGSVPHPSHHHPRSPLSPIGHSASRYTGVQPPRHPLSLSALRQALQGALSSKRYACSHLLALRFGKEERDDEVYWEDVRSVMGLLTTTLTDAGVRLTEALEEVERMRLQDEQPTPAFGGMRVLLDSEGEGEGEEEGKGDGIFGKQQQQQRHRRTKSKLALSSSIGFAPMPSHVARFAAHVDAISTALEDAREQLEQCVASLRKEEEEEEECHSRGHEEDDSHPALQAYERLRRELGLALRECERGREHLTDVVHPRVDHSDEEEDDEHADLPGLGHDGSDDLDDKPEPAEHEHHHQSHPELEVTVVNAADGNMDDVTSHLLFTATTEHLPPPGIEQVYEGDSGNVGAFKREKSKLSREERIALVKKARESGKRLSDLGIQLPVMMDEHCESAPKMERWGPGGEVVQELKDVIWKVGERRRKMTDGLGHVGPPLLRPGDVR